jgi:hypothetical protein
MFMTKAASAWLSKSKEQHQRLTGVVRIRSDCDLHAGFIHASFFEHFHRTRPDTNPGTNLSKLFRSFIYLKIEFILVFE